MDGNVIELIFIAALVHIVAALVRDVLSAGSATRAPKEPVKTAPGHATRAAPSPRVEREHEPGPTDRKE